MNSVAFCERVFVYGCAIWNCSTISGTRLFALLLWNPWYLTNALCCTRNAFFSTSCENGLQWNAYRRNHEPFRHFDPDKCFGKTNLFRYKLHSLRCLIIVRISWFHSMKCSHRAEATAASAESKCLHSHKSRTKLNIKYSKRKQRSFRAHYLGMPSFCKS